MGEQATIKTEPRRGLRKGIFLIPSAFTIGNILCGFYALISSIKGYESLADPARAAGFFDQAARSIGWAVLLDGLDGRIARMTGATSDFGVELDSIADVVSFGIAPAVLAYTWGYGSTPGLEALAWGASFFFLICGAMRLARFNVAARAPRYSQAGMTRKLDKRYFVGLPIPAAAGLLAAVVHFSPTPVASMMLASTGLDPEKGRLYSWLLLVVVATMALLMVSTLRYTSFKNIGPQSKRPFITLPFLSLIVAGIWFYSEWVLLLMAIAYVVHGPLLKGWHSLSRLWRGIEEEPHPKTPVEL